MKSWMHPKLRVILFLTLVNLVSLAFAFLALDRTNWFWFTPIALSINVLLFTYDQVLEFTRLDAALVEGQDPWGVLKLVQELSVKFPHRAPRVFLIDRPQAQAFTYARTGRRPRLFITTGALDLLNTAELRAVLTYQMVVADSAHSVINYWLGAAADLFYRLGRGIERVFAFVFGWAPKIANWAVGPVTWFLHYALLSPEDFTRLDAAAAARLDAPEDLARALWKMDAYAHTRPWGEPWVFAHMCMVSPLGASTVWEGLRIQPPVRARIEKLAGRYPL